MSGTVARCVSLGFVGWLGLVSSGLTEDIERRIVRGITPIEVREEFGFHAAESAGIFVGIRTFEDETFTEVDYAVDDAIDLAGLFTFELELIEPSKVFLALAGDPQKESSRDLMQRLLAAGALRVDATQARIYDLLTTAGEGTGDRGLFIVSLATHGFNDQGLDYLVASDSLKRRIVRTGVAVSELFDDVSQSSAPRRLVLLDACRERLSQVRGGTDPTAALTESFVSEIAGAQGQLVLAAATAGGFAYDDTLRGNGVFTGAIIDGLRGAAPSNESGWITTTTLSGYVNDAVIDWIARFRPEHKDISLGVSEKLEGSARHLPLAIDPAAVNSPVTLTDQRDAALALLGQNLGGGLITGQMFDRLEALLIGDEFDSVQHWWLARLEKLDGSLEERQRFAVDYRERFEDVGRPVKRRAGEPWTAPGFGMRFRYAPPGAFWMGSPDDEPERNDDEFQHRVTLGDGFWIGETEVTQGHWQSLMGNSPARFVSCGSTCPVERVNWFEALAFANAASRKSGFEECYRLIDCQGTAGEGMHCGTVEFMGVHCTGYRLPTEAEWEYAARAGTRGPFWTGDTLETKQANYDGNFPYGDASPGSFHQATVPVRTYAANPWRLYEVHGNVAEWVQDTYGTQTYVDGVNNPIAGSGSERVIRGGSWFNFGRFCRSASRHRLGPSTDYDFVGFRLLRTVPRAPASLRERG